MKTIQLIICLGFLLASYQSVSQDKKVSKEGYYVSEDGKLYWKGGKPAYLFVSESPDGSNAQRLTSEKSKEYTNPMFFDTEGVNFIRSQWAIDKDGNYASPRQEIMFEVYNDGTAPKTSVSFDGAPRYVSEEGLFYGKDLAISISATDAVSGVESIQLSKNGTAYADYNGVIKPGSDQSCTYKVYAVDNVGNTEEPLTFDFSVDVTSPTTQHSIVGDQSGDVLSPRATVELAASDNGSGVKSIFYKIDDGPVRIYSKGISLQRLTDGEHSIIYFSSDNVDNREDDKSYTFYLDRTEPNVVATVEGDQHTVGDKTYASTRTKIKLESTDNKSGVKSITYQVDKGDEITYEGPFELPAKSGGHQIFYYATDNVANNFQSLNKQATGSTQMITVDLTAPEIAHAYEGEMYDSRDTVFISSRTRIRLTASDSESGVKEITYKINGGSARQYADPFHIDKEGYYTIEYTGRDQVNNLTTSTFSFVIDNTGPVIETILSMEPVGSISLDDMKASLAVYASGVKLYLGATDEIVDTRSIYYSMNDGTEVMYTKPVNISEQGVNSFKVRALDKLGNETEIEASQIFIK